MEWHTKNLAASGNMLVNPSCVCYMDYMLIYCGNFFFNFVKWIYIKKYFSRYENGEKAQYHFKSRNHMYNVKDKYRCYFCNSYVQDTKGKFYK